MGLIGGILVPLYGARFNVLMSPVAFLQKPLRWLQAISKYSATISGGPNFAYELCVRKITPEQRRGLDLSSWTLAFNGAEPVRPETIDAFCEAFEPCGFRREAFFPCFGLAEHTILVSGRRAWRSPTYLLLDAARLAQGGVAVRASDYFGPGATLSGNSHFGLRFFPPFATGKAVAFLGHPDAEHCYTYLPDYARALVEVALAPESWGKVWICPSVGPTTARKMVEDLGKIAGKNPKVGALPSFLVRMLGLFDPLIREVYEMLYQFDRTFTLDSSAFEERFGWKATPQAQALAETWKAHTSL
jgi:acyl-CoA synthetase (AMP-forming)/AMP-acid ligase II